MKESKFQKLLKTSFWVIFIIGGLWVGFVPPSHELPPTGVTVKVTQTEEPPPLEAQPATEPQVSGGEEQTSQFQPPSEEGTKTPALPEKQEPLAPHAIPKIAIVIDDVGLDLKGSERAIRLPAPVTLSFLPYAVRVREQAKEAQRAGHELLLHMPMEPMGHEDPGPGALLVDLPMHDLQERFEVALASFTGFDGVNNHMGSKFTAYADGMNMVVDELQQRHLFFLDSRTSAQSLGQKIAEQKALPTISRDVFLDDDQSPEAIKRQLEVTEHIAKRKGYAVAIGHPHAQTMDVLETWVVGAQKEGYELVPLKSLVKNAAP